MENKTDIDLSKQTPGIKTWSKHCPPMSWRTLILQEVTRQVKAGEEVSAPEIIGSTGDLSPAKIDALHEGNIWADENAVFAYLNFYIWTERRVYFPTEYDSLCWCDSEPRNPPTNLEPEYKCVNGHDKCNEMNAGPECPLCEKR